MYGKTHSDEVKRLLSDLNIKNKVWQGENNPFFGSCRIGEDHPRYNKDLDREAWKNYKRKVWSITHQTYKKYKHEINPNDLPRTLCGVTGGFQLDHIISIKEGYENDINPETIGSKENLQMLPWEENLVKS